MTDVAFSRATLLSNRPMCDLTKREAERGVLAATSWAVPLRIQISGTPFTPLQILNKQKVPTLPYILYRNAVARNGTPVQLPPLVCTLRCEPLSGTNSEVAR